MPKKAKEVKGRIIINPDITFTDNDICRWVTGMSINEFVQTVAKNVGGKYDFLYDDEKVERNEVK